MGTFGMRYSFLSRDIIADSMELCSSNVIRWLNNVVGCDKNMPGA